METYRTRQTLPPSGKPKICIPIVERDVESILSEAARLAGCPCDLVEWRVDFFHSYSDPAQVKLVLLGLRSCLGEKGLLFTFRTAAEGGNASITDEAYAALNRSAAATGLADFIDLELIRLGEAGAALVTEIHNTHTTVIGSNHDFSATPDKADMVGRLGAMQAMGADIAKLAVMPKCREDVFALLDATREKKQSDPSYPIITMSMGKLGAATRLMGALYGSALTFGTAGASSAPGQIPADLLSQVLELLGDGK